jgi:hypothetical protein
VRVFWPAGLALALAIAAIIAFPGSYTRRTTNLDLADTGFRDTFIMFSKSEVGRCFVVNRRASTMRRGDQGQSGRKWDCLRIPAGDRGGPADTWLLKSKRKGKGTVFFVPVYGVRDWSYPFLYRFVRKHRKELDLPRVEWTQLFVNRLYQGLYLRVGLPFDLRKKDGGSGILREILTVQDAQLTKVDTRFDDAGRLYAESVVSASFPELDPPPPALAWLARSSPIEGTAFLMSNLPPHRLTLLPLPISLPDLFAAKNGRPSAGFRDERYSRWTLAPWRSDPADTFPFTESELEELKSDFEKYTTSFHRALRTDAELHRSLGTVRELLPERQAATSKLQLSLRAP